MSGAPACRVCGNVQGNATFTAREMMLGTRAEFDYVECAACGCVQIARVPDDLADYYPPDYFSFRPQRRLASSRMRAFVDRRRVIDALEALDPIGRIANLISKPLDYLEWVRIAGVERDAYVLDVGCGSGKLLLRMALGGFAHLEGLDPFVESSHRYPNGVEIVRRDVIEHAAARPGAYELVMFHHSFEHVPDPRAAMRAARGLLAPGGRILIRLPVADCDAFARYREHWVQLDAPRHLHLHTRASLDRLAAEAGLIVDRVVHDSTAFQFSGSELYVRDIALNAPERDKAIFDRAALGGYAREARRLNREGRGDQAAYYLRARET